MVQNNVNQSINQATKHSDVYGSNGPIIKQCTRLNVYGEAPRTEYWGRGLIVPCGRDGTVLYYPVMLSHFLDPPGNHPRGVIFPTVD